MDRRRRRGLARPLAARAVVTVAPVRRRRILWLAIAASIAGLGLVAHIPVTTRQGVNYEVSEHRLPLYLKAFEFLDRNAQYRQLAAEITRGAATDEARVLAVFNWTARRIQPAPAGWAVIDDHILNIIIRGYGTSDQRADVFATLVTYAGVPAFWRKMPLPGAREGIVLTFVKVDGRWVVLDVANGFLFRNARGALATLEDFAANRAVLPVAAGSLMAGSTSYSAIFQQLRTPPIPQPLRAELQMPWPRLWDQVKHAIGRNHDDGSER